MHLFCLELGVVKHDTEDVPPEKCDSQPPPLGGGDSPIAPVLHSLAFAKNFSSKYKSSNGTPVPRTYSDQLLDVSRQAVPQSIAMATNQSNSGSVAIDNNSPIPPVLETPGIKRIEKKLETTNHGNCKGVIDYDSPMPPVLQTPGVKQVMNVDGNGFTDDSQPSQQVGMVENGHNGALSNDSPIPPVMQTPGVKQLNRFIVDKKGNPVDLPTGLSQSRDESDIPEPPEMTFNYQVLYIYSFRSL